MSSKQPLTQCFVFPHPFQQVLVFLETNHEFYCWYWCLCKDVDSMCRTVLLPARFFLHFLCKGTAAVATTTKMQTATIQMSETVRETVATSGGVAGTPSGEKKSQSIYHFSAASFKRAVMWINLSCDRVEKDLETAMIHNSLNLNTSEKAL